MDPKTLPEARILPVSGAYTGQLESQRSHVSLLAQPLGADCAQQNAGHPRNDTAGVVRG
jgi:hypothetical protein